MMSNISNQLEAWIVNNRAYVWKFDSTVLIPIKAIYGSISNQGPFY